MPFLIPLAVLVLVLFIFHHFNPDHTDAVFIAGYMSALKKGKISLKAKPDLENLLSDSARNIALDASGMVSLVDVRLSDIVELKSATASKVYRKNFEETAHSLLVDRIAIDARGTVVAALVTKGIAQGAIHVFLRSANIKSFIDQASFDAEVDRRAGRQTAPSQI
jgi:hypothetical protein